MLLYVKSSDLVKKGIDRKLKFYFYFYYHLSFQITYNLDNVIRALDLELCKKFLEVFSMVETRTINDLMGVEY